MRSHSNTNWGRLAAPISMITEECPVIRESSVKRLFFPVGVLEFSRRLLDKMTKNAAPEKERSSAAHERK